MGGDGIHFSWLPERPPRHWIEIRYKDKEPVFCMDYPPNWWQRIWLRLLFGFRWEKQ